MRLKEAIRAYFEVVQECGDEWIIKCPHPDHNDRKPSASVNVVKGLWCCYSCGAAGSVERTLDGINIFFAEPTLEEHLNECDDLLREEQSVYYPETWLDQFDLGGTYFHPYWQSRFTDEVIRQFRLGYDPENNKCTYPMRDPLGRVLGVVRRSLDGSNPKYKYPFGVNKSSLLFNYDAVGLSNRLVVCEGAPDVMALAEAGVEAVSIYGSRMHQDQANLINKLGIVNIVLCFDNDEAGRKATSWVLDGDPAKGQSPPRLDPLISVARLPEDVNDIAEVVVYRRHECIETAILAL